MGQVRPRNLIRRVWWCRRVVLHVDASLGCLSRFPPQIPAHKSGAKWPRRGLAAGPSLPSGGRVDGSPGSRRRSDFAGEDCLKTRSSPIPRMGADAPQVGGESTRLSLAVFPPGTLQGVPYRGDLLRPRALLVFAPRQRNHPSTDFERSTKAESRAVVSAPRCRRQCRSLARILSISRDAMGERDHWIAGEAAIAARTGEPVRSV